ALRRVTNSVTEGIGWLPGEALTICGSKRVALPLPGHLGAVTIRQGFQHCFQPRRSSVRCLALNASFEPLTMVPVRRALRLVIEGKAEIVESDAGDVVRSERLTLPKPVIIRLVKFIHVPRRFRRQVTNTFLFA